MSLLSQFFPSGRNSGIPLDMLIVGGGGGSGGIAGNNDPGGNYTITNAEIPNDNRCHQVMSGYGGAGGVYEVFGYPAQPGSTYPITVGSGGAAGTGGVNGGTQGANGGNSSFTDPDGELFQANGGGGGGVGAMAFSPTCPLYPCSPAYVSDPTIVLGKPGGSGGGGALTLKTICPVPCATSSTERNRVECGGQGCYQGDFPTLMVIGSNPGSLIGFGGIIDSSKGVKTRWGQQRGNSTSCSLYSTDPSGDTNLIYIGGTGYLTSSGTGVESFSQNPIQRAGFSAAGDCTPTKTCESYGSMQNSITGTPACYGITRHHPGLAPFSCLLTPTAQPFIPAACYCGTPGSSCFYAEHQQSDPHPNDAGYGYGGIGVVSMWIACVPCGRPSHYWFSGPGLTGSSGSVTLRYPASFGATPAPQRSGSVDCSPNTSGYYTYRWTSPGSITLP